MPIIHAVPLAVLVSHLSGRCHLHSVHDGIFDVLYLNRRSVMSQCGPSSSMHLLLFCERKFLNSHPNNYRHPFFQTNCENIMVKPMNVKEFTVFFPVISWSFGRFSSKFCLKLNSVFPSKMPNFVDFFRFPSKTILFSPYLEQVCSCWYFAVHSMILN